MKQAHSTKAWECRNEDGGAEIVFAPDEETAGEFTHDGYSDEIRRRPEYDRFWQRGYVPRTQLINDGWWWTCHKCDCQIDSDSFIPHPTNPHSPVECGERLYCSEGCHQSVERRRELAAIRRSQVKAYILSKWRGCSKLSVWVFGKEATATFSFPGGKHSAKWKGSDPNYVSIVGTDQPAWIEWQANKR